METKVQICSKKRKGINKWQDVYIWLELDVERQI